VINWTRGNAVTGYRDRSGWKLGDIVNSSPVVVGAPSSYYDFNNYNQFRVDNQTREPLIYVGSNDGMVHAFRVSDGGEHWAYIAKNTLPKLKDIANASYCHNFYSNLTPAVFDAYVNNQWKTLMVVGQREGGDAYTCLDVTDPEPGSFDVRWDIEYPSLVETWSIPTLLRDKTLNEMFIAVASGPDPTGESRMLLLNLDDGSLKRTEDMSPGSSSLNMGTDPVTVDIDFDGFDDVLYVADLAGKLYRYDMSSYPWSQSVLFDTNGQPIQAKPIYTVDEQNRVLLYFGTGKYIEDSDIADTSQQSFYCVIDDAQGTTYDKSDLADQTSTITPLASIDHGWYIDLVQAPGERVTRPDALAAGTVYFTSFQPVSDACKAGGVAWLYTLDFRDGTNPDENDDTPDDGTDKRVTSLGDGIHSEPILDIGNEDIIIQSTNTDLLVQDTKGNILRVIVRSWRQLFQ
jgi:type IV pilus assembly protein PilY1